MAVATRRSYYQATHFLSLPLYNSKSKSQLENFAHKLRNDEYAEGIPQKAFRLPTSFHIGVADFIFETDRDVKAASKLLHRLDIQRIIKDATTATMEINDLPDHDGTITEQSKKVEQQVSPLPVSLIGVEGVKNLNDKSNGCEASSTMKRGAYGVIKDPLDRLRGVVRGIRREFASASFRLYSGPQDDEEEYVASRRMGYVLLGGMGCRIKTTFVDFNGNIVKKRRSPDWDATALCQSYENVEIARDIIIEKLSLCKEGRIRTFRGEHSEFVVDEYYEEIDSIPLPQEA